MKAYSDSNFTGDLRVFSEDVDCLDSGDFDNKISSFKLELSSYCIDVYSECGYTGNKATICGKSRWTGSDLSKNILSIKNPNNYNVTLFSKIYFKGK